MPSPLELLSAADESAPASPPPHDVLRSVKAEGGRRRLVRRRRNLAVAVLGLALVAVPAAALRSGSGGRPQEIDVAAGGGSEGGATELVPDASEPALVEPVGPDLVPGDPATTVPTLPAAAPTPDPVATTPTTAGATVAPAPGGSAVTTTAAPTTATTARVCRNSDDPACGAFRWDPAPAPNQPLVARFTKAPATAPVGDVTFELEWSDGDAGLTFHQLSTDGTALVAACSMTPRYGPWTPPPAAGASGTVPSTATFTAPGTYRVIASLSSADCTSPYGNDLQVETSITITAPPSTAAG